MKKKTIRQWDSGANRDNTENKLEYARFMCPKVIQRYAEYMHKHRKVADGSLREPDNWKGLFGEEHTRVCMDSLSRHYMDLWLLHEGFEAREDVEEALCAIMFNSMAYLHKVLKDKNRRLID